MEIATSTTGLPVSFSVIRFHPLALLASWREHLRPAATRSATALRGCHVLTWPPSTPKSCPACGWRRSEEHTSELQSLMRISYAVFCLKKKNSSIYSQPIHRTQDESS